MMNNRTFTISDTNKVKGFSIILMMMHHCFLSPERYEGKDVIFAPFSESFMNDAALAMKVCVALFVFASGYGIACGLKHLYAEDNGEPRGVRMSRFVAARGIRLWTSFVFIFFAAQLYEFIAVRNGHFMETYGAGGMMSAVYYIIDMLGLAQICGTPTYLATFWYISLAWIIIFVMPLFVMIYRNTGGFVLCALCLLLGVLFPVTGEHTYSYFPNYAFTLATGMLCAENDTLVKMSEFGKIPKALKFVIYVILIIACVYCRQLTRGLAVFPLWDGVISLLIFAMFFEFVNRWRGIGKALEVIGIYSADIFLVHNFIRVVFYYDFTYSFRYWWLIILVLLVTSLLISVLVEEIKKFIRYDRLVAAMIEQVK